jgi:type IV pilus assembly protein PilC
VDALEQSPGVLTDSDILTLRFANQSGTLSTAYTEMVKLTASRSHDMRLIVRQAITYGLCLTIVMAIALSFLMSFIAPTFQQIFSDFGLRLPASLDSLIEWCSSLFRILPLAVATLLIVSGLAWIFKLNRRLSRSGLARLWLPQLRASHLLRMLAMSSQAGRPVTGAVSSLARYHYDQQTRIRLLHARNEMEHGAAPFCALSDSHLLTDKEATAIAESVGDTRVWLLRKLAEWREENVNRQARLLVMCLQPAIVIFFGAMVLWIVTAFFSVLSAMITSLV